MQTNFNHLYLMQVQGRILDLSSDRNIFYTILLLANHRSRTPYFSSMAEISEKRKKKEKKKQGFNF